ncbi:MAG: 50S ribosomal protein L10 [Candidatus Latescibacteria bacterium]|nr:50S ribosomal protein L10 [Candidatus Latescibacterota bacterium]
MVTNEKLLQLDNIKNLVSPATAIYFADLSRIKAKEISGLRMKLVAMNVKVKVVKNRLTKRALNQTGIAGIENFLTGPTALIISYDDPLAAAKVIKDFTKKNAELKIKGAFFDNSVYPANQFDYLASLPSKPELLGELVGCLNSPIADLVFSLEAMIRQLIAGLDEIKEKKITEANKDNEHE